MKPNPPNLYVADARSKQYDSADSLSGHESFHSDWGGNYASYTNEPRDRLLLHPTDSSKSDQSDKVEIDTRTSSTARSSPTGREDRKLQLSQQSTPKVSFANGGKVKIPLDKHNPHHRSGAQRRATRYSIAAQPTLLGKLGAIWRNVYTKLGLRQWSFILVIIAYALLGGLIFSWLEKGHIRRANRALINDLRSESEQLVDNLTKINNQPWLYGNDETAVRQAMVEKVREYQFKKNLGPKSKPVWDLWDGVFFSFTVFTTIGYGHYTPVTKSGRLATIIYALIGIPLLLAILADFGRLLTRALKRIWSFIRNGLRRVLAIRRFKKFKRAAEQAGLDLRDETEATGGISDAVEEFNFPIPLAIFFIVAWMFICSAFFLLWERNWSYFDAFYFFFISLSTIGLGDLVPEHQKYMIANFPFVLIGLSLVTLVINLIQNKIEEMKEKAKQALEEQLGVEDEDETESISDQVEFDDETSDQDDEKGPIGAQPTKKPAKKGRTTLGIIQTYKLPKNRRQIATQTDDSFVRDIIYRESTKSRDRASDRSSQATGTSSEYYDAQSQIF